MDILLPFAGWLLVWCAGIALVAVLPRQAGHVPEPGALAWRVGAGFFVGAFVVTVWMRALSLAGIPFSRAAIGLPLLLLAGTGAWLAARRERTAFGAAWRSVAHSLSGRELAGGARAAWCALLAWLALRYALLLADVLAQPLYPWDAWIQWATKARVWFEARAWVPFATTDAWLAANGALYTDAAPSYPATIPLWQVWSSVALGRYDDAWMNLPWWFAVVAFALVVFGALRRMAFGPLAALVGAWIVVSLPLIDTHVALAGYADLPMAMYFTLAALATLAWIRSRTIADGALALLFALACPFIKTPGIVWAATLVPALVFAFLPRHALKIVAAALALGIGALVVLSQTTPVVLNYQLHLDFAPAWAALLESFFLLGNWNLLWYGVLGAAALAGTRLLAPTLAPVTAIVAAGSVVLFIVFGFTNARAWVETQTTINRAVLHLAPLAAVWMLAAFRAWSAGRADDEPVAAATAPEAA
jgi:hypothetical protein